MKYLSTLFVLSLLNLNLFGATTLSQTVPLNRAPTIMAVNAGIMAGGGSALPGADVQIRSRLNTDNPFFAGGEVGMFIYSDSGASGIVVPLLGTINLEFNSDNNLHPSVGISGGPVFSSGSGYSTTRLGLFFDPGLRIHINRGMDLAALARFGAIGSTFVAVPQLGVLFAI